MKGIALAGMLLAVVMVFGTGCSPEVGSETWCKQMKEKPKGEWTTNEAAAYAKHCVFRKP